jgi:hypothetical protein
MSEISNGKTLNPETYFNEAALYIIKMKLPDSQDKIEKADVKIQSFSPLGMSFSSSKQDFNELIHKILEVDLMVREEKISLKGVVVEAKDQVISLKWVFIQQSLEDGSDRRKAQRWLCGTEFSPTGICANPLKYNDFIHFSMEDISLNGAQIITSMRNKLLVPGMSLETLMNFPMIGQTHLFVEIIYCKIVSVRGKEMFSLGCRFKKITPMQSEMIGKYLLQFGVGTTPRELKEAGFKVASFLSLSTFSYVKTKEELDQVIDLRERSWKASEPLLQSAKREDFTDSFDAKSKIIFSSYKNRCFATIRLFFPQSAEEMEHAQETDIPGEVAPYNELCEMTRIVVDPDFRAAEVLAGLMNQAAISCLQNNRRYILSSAKDNLLPVYKKMGAKIVGNPFSSALFSFEARLIVFDIHKLALAEGVHPVVWILLYRDTTKFLTQNGLIQPTTLQTIKISFLKMIAPVILFAVNKIGLHKRKKSQATAAPSKIVTRNLDQTPLDPQLEVQESNIVHLDSRRRASPEVEPESIRDAA